MPVTFMPPFKEAAVEKEGPEEVMVYLYGENIPDAFNKGKTTTSDLQVSFRSKQNITPKREAEFVAAAQIVHAIHEAFEFTTLDGERLAATHPDHEGEMWSYLAQEALRLVRAYKKRFPL